jgi:hypothetical protein
MKKWPRILLAVFILFLLYGLMPYKFPESYTPAPAVNRILVQHQECTCCADFDIVKGEIAVPDNLKRFFTNPPGELNVSGKDNPMNCFGDANARFDMLCSGKLILEGTISGIDSTDYIKGAEDCRMKPIFKVSRWGLNSYFATCWTFGRITALFYAISLFITFLILISMFSLYISGKLKTFKKKDGSQS